MIRQLRHRFFFSITASAFVLIMIVVSSINLLNAFFIDKRTAYMLDYISENQGVFSQSGEQLNPLDYINPLSDPLLYKETSYITRFFIVELANDGSVLNINLKNIASVNDDDAVNYARKALATEKKIGYYKNLYKFKVTPLENSSRICFVDVNKEITYVGNMFTISMLISFFFFFIMSVLIALLSKHFIKPVELNSLKQKQFIADAGHELKTPLAIISANTEVIEMTNGKNEWTSSIRKQTGFMTELVNQMLTLAKLEERNDKSSFKQFSISEVVENTAKSFSIIAEKSNKKLHLSIWPTITYLGDERSIYELVTILIDNAINYSPENSDIEISLIKKGKNIIFSTENYLNDSSTLDTNRLFDRFYRSDKSRSRKTGGYGIGLSIAKAVVENHKGDISAEITDGKIIFTVTLTAKSERTLNHEQALV